MASVEAEGLNTMDSSDIEDWAPHQMGAIVSRRIAGVQENNSAEVTHSQTVQRRGSGGETITPEHKSDSRENGADFSAPQNQI